MRTSIIIKALVFSLIFTPIFIQAATIDYPHFVVNNIGCDSCHFVYGSEPSILPPWTVHIPQDIDDTQYNTLCWSCHNDIDAPYVKTHSSLQIDDSYGDWTVECRVCHNPHYQKQFKTYGSASYLYSETVASVTATTLTKSGGAGWTVNAYAGLVVVPNVSQKNYNYKILSNTSEVLTVQGPMDLTRVSAGNVFAIVYGKLIYDSIDLSKITITPPKSGSKTTRFFKSTGSKSFADGDGTYDGVCEVCHTQTTHFRNNGTGSDQLHTNMGAIPGTDCTNCHNHVNGFRGMGGGVHTTHVLEGYGPRLACADCHGSYAPPLLADGQNLANTTVCDNCHSSSGAADAKNNWGTNPGTWAATYGEEGYCGSCHDLTPGNSNKDGTGDNAPDIVGNKTSYGFFVTGHGRPTRFGQFVNLSYQQEGRLMSSDFIITDVNDDNPAGPADKAITGVQHTAGSQSLVMYINVTLIGADIGADTITPVGNQVFDSIGNAMGTTPIVITNTDTTAPTITKVEGMVGSNQIMVYFSEPVYTNSGATGALLTSDFTLTDNDNGRTILSIAHLAGDQQARLTLSSNLDSADDMGADTLAAVGFQIYDGAGNPMGTSPVVITDPSSDTTAPAITKIFGSAGSNQLTIYFSEPVYTNVNTFEGNPAANRQCSDCHDLTTQHFNSATDRLKAGFENNANNSNCRQCHYSGGIAYNDPEWYTTYSTYESSAHKAIANLKCTSCHDVHGASGPYPGMTEYNRQSLCNQASCHPGQAGHDLDVTYGKGGKPYSLDCISCHNVHVVTGMFSAAVVDKSPMSPPSDNLTLWGDESGEKMDDYTGSGLYRTPNGDTMSGSQLPDYVSFCLDCHGGEMSPSGHGSVQWATYDPHGKVSANSPDGGGKMPDWYGAAKAEGRDGDDCTGSQEQCWPVLHRGRGEQAWSREPYYQQERIAGANFTLSCSDCHVTHESGIGSKLRTTVNNGPGSTSWNTMCNNCHWYYTDWHSYSTGGLMGCGSASCHEVNSIHRIKKNSGNGATRNVNNDLVADMRFENNLNDSGDFRLHGRWYGNYDGGGAGSFVSGKFGQAIQVDGNQPVELGTRNANWSTDEGISLPDRTGNGTWKYTEMKYNTTLEAWVYPTDNANSEYVIFTKDNGKSSGSGGYTFTLKKINGTLRAVFNMEADNNGFTQGGAAGIRGAYSSVGVPLNKWTHIAATFDTNGTDRNPSDPTVGRIRIYVNGEDVTTSDSSGNNIQTGTNETSIYAYSENSPWNESVCFVGNWCTTAFSIGGKMWGSGFRSGLIGKIDEVKVWNITKDAVYFASYDSQTAPYISHVEGLVGGDQLDVTFSEGVYTSTGSSGELSPSDFTLTDTGDDNPRTIIGVTHTAGSSNAVITMSQPLTANDVNSDTLAAATASSIYDDYNNAMGTETVTIGLSSQCPTSPVSIQLNEPSGSTYIMDTQGILYGVVYGGAATLTGSEYSGGGDGSGRYIMFDYNTTCLQASTAMTIETRTKPTGMAGTGNYIRRILDRTSGGDYQISVWRNNTTFTPYYNAPSGEASIALWINVVDNHGGNSWKPVLTNYTGAKGTSSENDCPIVSDHWYQVKAIWNTNKPGGTPDQFFMPADILIDDQGTDGFGAGENWSGYINCTDSDQSLKPDASKFYTGDQIIRADGNFAIGTSRANPANNLFNGLIDWITWKDSVD